ncbi:MAG: hypothetical protein BGO37_04920 [Cellulomonas sp. 73-92]|nr:MAG: hypothetical protein BGO37_04920 [Cellulomonas sp. 73-92]
MRSRATTSPTSAAHTGSVPSSRPTWLGDERWMAHVCAAKPNTVHTTARYASTAHRPPPSWATKAPTGARTAAVSTAKTTATVASCTAVSRRTSSGRRSCRTPIVVTWPARSTAAARTRRSPGRGLTRWPSVASSTAPATASAAAPRNARPGARRRTRPSASGVRIIVSEMRTPALVADVIATP